MVFQSFFPTTKLAFITTLGFCSLEEKQKVREGSPYEESRCGQGGIVSQAFALSGLLSKYESPKIRDSLLPEFPAREMSAKSWMKIE